MSAYTSRERVGPRRSFTIYLEQEVVMATYRFVDVHVYFNGDLLVFLPCSYHSVDFDSLLTEVSIASSNLYTYPMRKGRLPGFGHSLTSFILTQESDHRHTHARIHTHTHKIKMFCPTFLTFLSAHTLYFTHAHVVRTLQS